MSGFQRAEKTQSWLRFALLGPSGGGKTYSALRIAQALGGKVALIDTEHGTAKKYADIFEFNTLELESFHPQRYIDAIKLMADEGHTVGIVDSLSHAWAGKDGLLEFVDQAKARSRGNQFAAWGEATPLQNALVEAMLTAPLHLIVTMRTKMAYVQEQDEKGRTVVRKIGLQPVQRDGLEYEFDVVGDLDQENTLVITKTRCPALKRAVIKEPGEELAKTLKDWVSSGAPRAEEEAKDTVAATPRDASSSADGAVDRPRGPDGAVEDPTLVARLSELLLAEGIPQADIDLVLNDKRAEEGGPLHVGWLRNEIGFAEARAKKKAAA